MYTLAYIQWFKIHTHRDMLGASMEVCQKSYFPTGMYSFIPVAQIRYAIAFSSDSCNGEDVFVTMLL